MNSWGVRLTWFDCNDLEINLEGRPALFKYADDSTIFYYRPFLGKRPVSH